MKFTWHSSRTLGRTAPLLLTISLAVVLAACSGNGAGSGARECMEGGTGTLVLSLTIPSETFVTLTGPAIYAYGPDGSEHGPLNTSGEYELPSGSYTIEIRRGITAPDPAVGKAFGVDTNTVRTLCIPDGGEASLSVSFQEQAGAGRLWVSDGDRLLSFSSSQLASAGAPSASVLDGSLINDFRGFDFDAMGNLWAVTGPTYGTRVLWLEPAQIATPGALSPRGTITTSYFDAQYAPVSDLFFGPDGTLWLGVRRVDDTFNGLIGFSRATLAEALLSGGDLDLVPDYVHSLPAVTGPIAMSRGPASLTFVADFEGDAIHRIDDLRGNGSGVDATFTVRVTGALIRPAEGPLDLAWYGSALGILFETTNELITLNETDIALTPGAQIDITGPTGFAVDQLPSGLAASDGYWVGNQASPGEILRFDTGGATNEFLTTAELDNPVDLRFNPAPQ